MNKTIKNPRFDNESSRVLFLSQNDSLVGAMLYAIDHSVKNIKM